VPAAGQSDNARQKSLGYIAQHYWKPVYCYIRGRGYTTDDAKDLTQGFFQKSLQSDFFAKADPARGRFRAYLLSSLKNFIANARRDAGTKKRKPAQGFIPVHELATVDGPYCVPADKNDPERIFNHSWTSELLMRVLHVLEAEYKAAGKQANLELFRQRIIDPALHGTEAPPLADLARQLGMTEKESANRLLTARRAFQRLLREEIRRFANSEEEVTAEIQELFRSLGNA